MRYQRRQLPIQEIRELHDQGLRYTEIASMFGCSDTTVGRICGTQADPPMPRLIFKPEPWTKQAACLDVPDPDIFYPAAGAHADEAKAVCAGCKVRDECLAFALRTEGVVAHGVWGGLSERERRKLKGSAA